MDTGVRIGDAITQSSGVFTFPATGYWLIELQFGGLSADVPDYLGAEIETTTNNSSYCSCSRRI